MKIASIVLGLCLMMNSCFLICYAEQYAVKYPDNIIDSKSKLVYTYRLLELLRLEHNKKGKDYRDGIITKTKWKAWKQDYFNPRENAVIIDLQKYKCEFKNSMKDEATLKNAFIKKNTK